MCLLFLPEIEAAPGAGPSLLALMESGLGALLAGIAGPRPVINTPLEPGVSHAHNLTRTDLLRPERAEILDVDTNESFKCCNL